MPAGQHRTLLTSDLLTRFAGRSAEFGRADTCFIEDFEELRAIGYLKLAVPERFGGPGRGLADVVCEQRRLAYRSPATALAVNTHLYWTGAAAEAHRSGDTSLGWLLREAAAGAVFAAGQREPGQDLPLARSGVRAEPGPGGVYRFYGRRVLTSLSPVWTWLGLHALDDSDPQEPKMVCAFIGRGSSGYRILERPGAHAARSVQSNETVLEGARARPMHIARVLPAAPTADMFISAVLGWALVLSGAVYRGVAQRAFDLTIESARDLTPGAGGERPVPDEADIEWSIPEALLELAAVSCELDGVIAEWLYGPSTAADRKKLIVKLFTARRGAIEGAKRVADLALRADGPAIAANSERETPRGELERLRRALYTGVSAHQECRWPREAVAASLRTAADDDARGKPGNAL
jgi:alkylation response protein AidB-like acyl-CoA dehydrogenase